MDWKDRLFLIGILVFSILFWVAIIGIAYLLCKLSISIFGY